MGAASLTPCWPGVSCLAEVWRRRRRLEAGDVGNSWLSSRLDPASVAQSVFQHGLCQIDVPVLSAEVLAELTEATAANFAEVLVAVEAWRSSGEFGQADFSEAVERDGNRWDVRHRMQEPPFTHLLKAPPWADAVGAILGQMYQLLFSGVVIALGHPGAEPVNSDLTPLRPTCIPSTATWFTAGLPDLQRTSGAYYHEVILLDDPAGANPQLGWLAEDFAPGPLDMNGVGDDENGWAADGVRHFAWHRGAAASAPWPREWQEGDCVGCAVDIVAGRMRFALNGEWCDAADMQVDIGGRALYPAVSLRGDFRLLVAESDWRFRPPCDGFGAWASGGTYVRPTRKVQPQQWHQDGEPLFMQCDSGGTALPPHCINVFVPLVDVDAANGATEFVPGSHKLDLGSQLDLKARVQPSAVAGSALLFDYRLAHRGGENTSGVDRAVLYFTYAASWFRDPANHRSTRSLFDE